MHQTSKRQRAPLLDILLLSYQEHVLHRTFHDHFRGLPWVSDRQRLSAEIVNCSTTTSLDWLPDIRDDNELVCSFDFHLRCLLESTLARTEQILHDFRTAEGSIGTCWFQKQIERMPLPILLLEKNRICLHHLLHGSDPRDLVDCSGLDELGFYDLLSVFQSLDWRSSEQTWEI